MGETIDESDMYGRFELFQKFIEDRNSLTPLESIKLRQFGIRLG
jgi:hypothetical protein